MFEVQSLDNPPSIAPGFTLEDDRKKRRDVCTFILKLGEKATLNNFVIATAAVYFHTFFMRYSFAEYNAEEIGFAALFLATKVEDSRRKLSDLQQFFYEESKILPVPHPSSQEFKDLRQKILRLEMLLLEAVEFNFDFEKPYDSLKDALRELSSDCEFIWWNVCVGSLYFMLLLIFILAGSSSGIEAAA